MKKSFATVVFDRKHKIQERGYGKVEVLVMLTRQIKKYITIKECTESEWKRYQTSVELEHELETYNSIVVRMQNLGVGMTIEVFNSMIGADTKKAEDRKVKKMLLSPTGFIEFIKDQMSKERLAKGTLIRRQVAIKALERYGRMCRFSDLTPKNVKGFDDFLREEDPSRTDQSLNNYHKVVRKYCRLAHEYDYIPKNPYKHPLCHFNRGESKEREALEEFEIEKIKNAKGLTGGEEHARDIFLFSVYTGLAYCDNQAFDFATMTEKLEDGHYIDGERIKNGHKFFTPILPPAMAILEKYDYKLPKMSIENLNKFLHMLESRAGLRKPLTSHVARHTFATLMLNHDIPFASIARMLGHKNIRTTQIYAKILKKSVAHHSEVMTDIINQQNAAPVIAWESTSTSSFTYC